MAAIKKIKLNNQTYQVHPGYQTTDDFDKANFAVGAGTEAIGIGAMSEGNGTSAIGDYSHSQGFGTISDGENQTVLGRANVRNTNDYAFIIGNGEVQNEEIVSRSNAMTVSWDGTVSAKKFIASDDKDMSLSGRNGVKITSASDTVYVELDEANTYGISARNGVKVTSANNTAYFELDETYNTFGVSARNGVKITSADNTAYFEIDEDYNAMELQAGQGINIITAGNIVTISSEIDTDDMLTIQGENIGIRQNGSNVVLSAEPGLSNYEFETSNNITATIDPEDKIIHITATDYTADTLGLQGENISIKQNGSNVVLSAGVPFSEYTFEGTNVNVSVDNEDRTVSISAKNYMENSLALEGENIKVYESSNKIIISANDAINEILNADQNNIEITKENGQLTFTVPEQKNYTFAASGAAKVKDNNGNVTIYAPVPEEQMVYEVESSNESLLKIDTSAENNVTTFIFKPVDPMDGSLTLSGIGIDIQEKDNKLVLSAEKPKAYTFNGINCDIDVDDHDVTISAQDINEILNSNVDIASSITDSTVSTQIPTVGAVRNYVTSEKTDYVFESLTPSLVNITADSDLVSISAKDPYADTMSISGIGINIYPSGNKLVFSAVVPEKDDEEETIANLGNYYYQGTSQLSNNTYTALNISAYEMQNIGYIQPSEVSYSGYRLVTPLNRFRGIPVYESDRILHLSAGDGITANTVNTGIEFALDYASVQAVFDQRYPLGSTKPVSGVNLAITEYSDYIELSAGGGNYGMPIVQEQAGSTKVVNNYDNFTAQGFYSLNSNKSNSTNCPEDGITTLLTTTGGSYKNQLSIGNDYFYRYKSTGDWTDWTKLATSNDLKSYATTASLTAYQAKSGMSTYATTASLTGYVPFVYSKSQSYAIADNSPATACKAYFSGGNVNAPGIQMVYNYNGSEKTLIFSRQEGGKYGTILSYGYEDTYLKILRVQDGEWKSAKWEPIAAGSADIAGSVYDPNASSDKTKKQYLKWSSDDISKVTTTGTDARTDSKWLAAWELTTFGGAPAVNAVEAGNVTVGKALTAESINGVKLVATTTLPSSPDANTYYLV